MHLGWDMGEIARLELVELYVFEVEFAQRHLGLDRGGSVQVKLAAFEVEPQALGNWVGECLSNWRWWSSMQRGACTVARLQLHL